MLHRRGVVLLVAAAATLSCGDSCTGERAARPLRAIPANAATARTPESLVTCAAGSLPPGYTAQTLAGTHGPRTYGLFVPQGASPGAPLPVVLGFHGDGGTGASMRNAGLEAATGAGAILVYPDGRDHAWDLETAPADNEDYVFFDELVDDVAKKTCIDPRRIFLFGFSRGGFFANQLACHRGNMVRGIASMSGGGPYSNARSDFDGLGIFRGCTTPPTAALVIHGDADNVVPPIAGEKCVRHWRVTNGCGATSVPHEPAPCVTYAGCAPGHPVMSCTVPGMGHQVWTEAAATSWAFFRTL
ncbi:MAG: hypothetical protein JWP97_795 [Labilithrix sp.]|nr:hypothetical protein [Labilithrix sp.]